MTGSHIDDGDLLRWIDGECDVEERNTLGGHLAACAICDNRMSVIETWSTQFSAALRSTRARASASARWRRALATAAGIVILVGFAVQPVRAWVVQRAVAVWYVVTGSPIPDQPATPFADVPRASANASMTFVPVGPLFELHVEAWQATGGMTITTAAEGHATLTLVGGDGREELVVLPSGLRIVNDAGSWSSYDVRIPAVIREVRVIVADGPAWRFATGAPGQSRTIAVVRNE
jgi:hypothetical protein